MTERGLPLADGAPACPFVAFEDDRDERSSVPDHRHRCYADARPAPRALAHQEAYCLSSAFPVCPTFQDWARREAARSRGGAATAPSASAGMNRAASGAVAEGAASRAAADAAGSIGSGGLADGGPIADPAAAAASAAWGRSADPAPDRRDAEPDGDDAGRVHDADPGVDPRLEGRPAASPYGSGGDDQVRRNPPRDWAAPPPWLASNEARPRADDADPPAFLGHRVTEPGQGLAGSPADRLAGGAPPPRRDDGPAGDWSSESRSAAAVGAGLAAGGGAGSGSAGRPYRDGDDEDDPGESRIGRRPRAYAQHLGGPDGPDWERPRRFEAYPTLRSRVSMPGMPGIPRVAGLALVVVVLAAALFFLPGILNLGGAAPGPAGSPGASLAARPSVSLAPTAVPAPTPIVYTVKAKDTLSKIATAHGLTLAELLAANPTIKNPNLISEGQQIIIPTPSPSAPDTIDGSAAP